MRSFDDYLDDLRSRLTRFDETDRVEVLEEIESHIEAGVADGRFQSNPLKLLGEMGSPAELVDRLSSGKRRRRWQTLLILLLPFLFVDEAAYWLSLFEFMSGGLPGENSVIWFVLTGVILIIIVSEYLLSWRRRSVIIALWWSSVIAAHFSWPLFAAWFNGWPIHEFVSAGSVMVLIVALLPFVWLVWRARFDSLLLVFGSLPLTLGLLTNSLWISQINMVINFQLFGIDVVLEPLIRLLMWCGVMASYFLLRKQWLRWFGIISIIFFYLFFTAVFITTTGKFWVVFPPVTAVLIWTSIILLLGMVSDRYRLMRKELV